MNVDRKTDLNLVAERRILGNEAVNAVPRDCRIKKASNRVEIRTVLFFIFLITS